MTMFNPSVVLRVRTSSSSETFISLPTACRACPRISRAVSITRMLAGGSIASISMRSFRASTTDKGDGPDHPVFIHTCWPTAGI